MTLVRALLRRGLVVRPRTIRAPYPNLELERLTEFLMSDPTYLGRPLGTTKGYNYLDSASDTMGLAYHGVLLNELGDDLARSSKGQFPEYEKPDHANTDYSNTALAIRNRLKSLTGLKGMMDDYAQALVVAIRLVLTRFVRDGTIYIWVLDLPGYIVKSHSNSQCQNKYHILRYEILIERGGPLGCDWQCRGLACTLESVLSFWLACIQEKRSIHGEKSIGMDDVPHKTVFGLGPYSRYGLHRDLQRWMSNQTGCAYGIVIETFDADPDIEYGIRNILPYAERQNALLQGADSNDTNTQATSLDPIKMVTSFFGPIETDAAIVSFTDSRLAIREQCMSQHVFANFMWSVAKFIPREKLNTTTVTIPPSSTILNPPKWESCSIRSEDLSSLISDIQIHAQKLGSQKDIEHLILPPLSWHGLLSYHSFVEKIVDFPQRFKRYASEQASGIECMSFENDLFEILERPLSRHIAPIIDEELWHRVVATFQEARFDLLVYFAFPELTQDPCRTQWMFKYRKLSSSTSITDNTKRMEVIIHDVETLYHWQKRSQMVLWSHPVEEPNERIFKRHEIRRLSQIFGYREWHIAITQGSLDDLERLAKTHQRMTHVLAADILGWTPLHYAVAYHHKKIFRDHYGILNRNLEGLPRDVAGRTPLHYAVMHDSYAGFFDLGINPVEWAEKDRCGMTPLHYAARFGNVEAIIPSNSPKRYSLYDTPGRDITGRTIYHWAVIGGKTDMMEILKTKKWNFMVGDENGDTPLHYAVRYGRLEAVKYLVCTERDHLLTKNKKNNTAEDESRLATNMDIQDLLEQAGVASSSDAEWDLFMWLLQWDC